MLLLIPELLYYYMYIHPGPFRAIFSDSLVNDVIVKKPKKVTIIIRVGFIN